MKKIDLQKQIARLESMNDYLQTEVDYVDHLMRLIGFSNGLETVKLTARELFESERREGL